MFKSSIRTHPSKVSPKIILLSFIVPQVLQKKRLKRSGKAESLFNEDKDIDSLFTLISNRWNSLSSDFLHCFFDLASLIHIKYLICSGDYEVTMDGIHENFLRLSYHDPMLQKTVSIYTKR